MILFQEQELVAVMTPNPQRERKELGPKQLEWCRRVIPHFRHAKKVADRVQAETEKSREKLTA